MQRITLITVRQDTISHVASFFGFYRCISHNFWPTLVWNSEGTVTSLRISIVWIANQIANRQGQYQGRISTAAFHVEAYSPWGRGWCYIRPYHISSTNFFIISGIYIGVLACESSLFDRIDFGVFEPLLIDDKKLFMFIRIVASLSAVTYEIPESKTKFTLSHDYMIWLSNVIGWNRIRRLRFTL